MEIWRPVILEDLFRVFERLEHGVSVLVCNAGDKDIKDTPAPSSASAGTPRLGLYSSGSTGEPKLFWKDWDRLKRGISYSQRCNGWLWASPFLPWTFAGVSVGLQAWGTGGGILSLNADWEEDWRKISVYSPDAVSATPTYLDLLIQNEAGAECRWTPNHITLGGEPLRPNTGRRLARRFGSVRFLNIYAASELGVIAKSPRVDGWFDVTQLAARFCRWRIEEKRLELFREGCWISTGDQVDARDGMFRVNGRITGTANVGGLKVDLNRVSALAESARGIRRATAVATSDSLLGQTVRLNYEIDPEHEEGVVESGLKEYLRAKLPKYAWPRIWSHERVEIGNNAKRLSCDT
ncbi:MAG: acyl--CoA ligase [Verrucomicrobia bacterium]|nr:acyl--CoA ligase [Verrucomicrobiota bacterium]